MRQITMFGVRLVAALFLLILIFSAALVAVYYAMEALFPHVG